MRQIGRSTPAPLAPGAEAVVRRRPGSSSRPSVDRLPQRGAKQPSPSPMCALHKSPEAVVSSSPGPAPALTWLLASILQAPGAGDYRSSADASVARTEGVALLVLPRAGATADLPHFPGEGGAGLVAPADGCEPSQETAWSAAPRDARVAEAGLRIDAIGGLAACRTHVSTAQQPVVPVLATSRLRPGSAAEPCIRAGAGAQRTHA
jgi:hypothetical protein